MLVMHYSHRLPADYAMDRIRERVAARGALWDAVPGLGFKAFSTRERGRFGAEDNGYASFYLWRDAVAAGAFLTDDRFEAVQAGFGRPDVRILLPLAVRVVERAAVRALHHGVAPIPPGTDLATLRREEAARAADAVAAGAAAAVSALDPARWQVERLILAAEPDPDAPGRLHQVLHLARPGWAAFAGEV
ncbi:DUF4865 family protein [Methylobacterium sp. ID0610]|uniref:DUF4865 family protein n=1 Tax=Methylobacterium carpenticola TaxID=3344827 RepID=UPI003683E399